MKLFNSILFRLNNVKKGKAMETKQDVIRHFEKKIDGQKTMIRENIRYLIGFLNEMDSALNIISYLSYLKNDFIKKRFH